VSDLLPGKPFTRGFATFPSLYESQRDYTERQRWPTTKAPDVE
jgi:hypothetical protein